MDIGGELGPAGGCSSPLKLVVAASAAGALPLVLDDSWTCRAAEATHEPLAAASCTSISCSSEAQQGATVARLAGQASSAAAAAPEVVPCPSAMSRSGDRGSSTTTEGGDAAAAAPLEPPSSKTVVEEEMTERYSEVAGVVTPLGLVPVPVAAAAVPATAAGIDPRAHRSACSSSLTPERLLRALPRLKLPRLEEWEIVGFPAEDIARPPPPPPPEVADPEAEAAVAAREK